MEQRADTPRVSVIVLGYGKAPTLLECIDALEASVGVDLEIVVVDNGFDDEVRDDAQARKRVVLAGPSTNRGFAGGCNHGVACSTGNYVVLINDDAFVEPDALRRMIERLDEPGVGMVSGSLRLDDQPDVMNSAGNPIHFSGMTWSGAFGTPASDHQTVRDVPVATGAALATTRALWDQLGGFDEQYFAYLEDTDVSLRCWQSGNRVVFEPAAIVRHRYEFSRNSAKFFLIERNRHAFVLTNFSLRTILVLAPALLFVEILLLAQATVGGWLGHKLRAYAWVVRHIGHIRRRRAWIQERRVRTDRELRHLFSAEIVPGNVDLPPGMSIVNAVLRRYWAVARQLL